MILNEIEVGDFLRTRLGYSAYIYTKESRGGEPGE